MGENSVTIFAVQITYFFYCIIYRYLVIREIWVTFAENVQKGAKFK